MAITAYDLYILELKMNVEIDTKIRIYLETKDEIFDQNDIDLLIHKRKELIRQMRTDLSELVLNLTNKNSIGRTELHKDNNT